MLNKTNTLDNLFGSRVKVKILKNAFRNHPADFNISELSRRIQEPIQVVKKEVAILVKIGLIRTKIGLTRKS